jgi:RNA polymerase sigma factor (sigma-70 family)
MGREAGWLRYAAKDHKKWVSIVCSFGGCHIAEDIVQEAYLVLYKYTDEESVVENGRVNQGYMFYTLRSVYVQYNKIKQRVQVVSIDDEEYTSQIPDHSQMDEEIGYHSFIKLLDKEMENFNWYDRKLWKLYSQTDMSIRKIAAETTISWVSIFNSLKNIKNKLKEALHEDYEDYKNKDYEYLK